MSDRSLRTVVNDDGLVLPRWAHHLVKLGTGAIALVAILAALSLIPTPSRDRPIVLGAALSLAWFLSLRIDYWLEHRHDDDPAQLIKPDLWCDLALQAAPIAGVLAYDQHVLAGAVFLLVCVVAYALTYPEASP